MRVVFRAVLKTFHFSLASCDCSSSCPSLPLPNSPFSHTKPPFSSSFLHQSSRKGMGYVSFLMYFIFLALDFLDCVCVCLFVCFFFFFFDIWKYDVYGLLMFCWVWCMGFLGNVFLHYVLDCTWCHLLHTHTLWHDWDLNVMFLGFYSKILIWD